MMHKTDGLSGLVPAQDLNQRPPHKAVTIKNDLALGME